jgi:two-component system invasion response regulator UvrY
MKVRILIADDHAVVRQGLKQVLADEFADAEFGEAGTAPEALSLASQGHWDVVVTDISMPGRSGLELLKDLQAIHPHLPVLVLSMHPEDEFAVRVIRAGAAGYLNKDTAPAELAQAVRKVMAGGRYVSAALAEQLATGLQRGGDKPPHELLSDREFEVFRLIASGKAVKEIAAELSLSVKTISTYRTRVLEKMNLRTNADLMRYATQRGLV